MQRPSHIQFRPNTAKIVARILKRRNGRKLMIHVEKMCLDLEEQKDAESNITANCRHR